MTSLMAGCPRLTCSRRSDSGARTKTIESGEKTRKDSLAIFSPLSPFFVLAPLPERLEQASPRSAFQDAMRNFICLFIYLFIYLLFLLFFDVNRMEKRGKMKIMPEFKRKMIECRLKQSSVFCHFFKMEIKLDMQIYNSSVVFLFQAQIKFILSRDLPLILNWTTL